MGIKVLFLANFLVLLSWSGISQGLEEQRKYAIPKSISNERLIEDINGLNGFSSHHHSTLIYYDLYMDTPDLRFFDLGYSLRFRKRYFNDSTSSYSFQLKSEMNSSTEIRMEIDEPELTFYRVKEKEKWVSLEIILDRIFSRYEESSQPNLDTLLIQQLQFIDDWISLKINGSIAPFQKFRYQHPKEFKYIKSVGLIPIICGKSERSRGHIYIDKGTKDTSLSRIPLNKIKMDDKPQFFVDQPFQNWILEFSLDNSEFFAFNTQKEAVRFREFELENKYMNGEEGTVLLERFEDGLTQNFLLTLKLDSKYRQCLLYLNNLD
jgi:hypothetical protein